MFENLSLTEIVALYQGKPKLAKALVKAMSEIGAIEKNSNVKTGATGSYKAVQDKDVKIAVRKILIENGLSIIPAIIDEKTHQVEKDKGSYKTKEIFVDCKTTYIIMHESGEAVPAQGLGHGVDSLDKAAGKATTYALKYFELYLFQIPTGDIDDADKTEPAQEDQKTATQAKPKEASKPKETTQTKPKEEVKEKSLKEVENFLKESKDMTELAAKYNSLTAAEKALGKEAKDKMKAEFSPTK